MSAKPEDRPTSPRNNANHDTLAVLHKQRSLTPEGQGLRSRSRSPVPSISAEEEASPLNVVEKTKKEKPVKWRSLPKKDQLLIMVLIRLAEPITQTSLTAYMFYMLKSFDETKSDSEISSQAGILQGSYTAAQCLTAIWWGRLADREWMGRKNVLLMGLMGTCIASLGFGFSRSFYSAVFFRALGGGLNGNVGIMRTMISEIIKEKKFQIKAFLLLPVTFNVGVLVGPLLGGWLQNPVQMYPGTFGPGSRLGGENGVGWMMTFPYALPNIITSIFLLLSAVLGFFGLKETHIDRQNKVDYGYTMGKWLVQTLQKPFKRHTQSHLYTHVDASSAEQIELDNEPQSTSPSVVTLPKTPRRPKLPYRRIFTPNVIRTYLTLAFLHIHASAFNTLLFLFLSTPRFDPENPGPPSRTTRSLPFLFSGGLGMPPPTIGFAIGIIGGFGLLLQFGLYSRITHRLGLLQTFRFSLLMFPLTYALTPYLSLLPSSSPSPSQPASGPLLWIVLSLLLLSQVTGRTFSIPIMQILINNSTPHPSVLGAVHGFGQSVSSGARTLGPVVFSVLYGLGLRKGVVGLAWWCLAGWAVAGWGVSWAIYEGSGHEVLLEGEEEDDEGRVSGT